MSEPSLAPTSNRPRPHPAIRALVAMACGLAIGSIAYVHAWKNSRHNRVLFANQYAALDDMSRIASALSSHLQETGTLPTDLRNVALPNNERFKRDDTGAPLDPWSHPYVYHSIDDRFQLQSFGRDGVPGGLGLDADIPSEPPHRFVGESTMHQFAFEIETDGIAFTCALAAFSTVAACWILMQSTSTSPLMVKLIGWGMTLGIAFMVAQIMAVLHLPTGH